MIVDCVPAFPSDLFGVELQCVPDVALLLLVALNVKRRGFVHLAFSVHVLLDLALNTHQDPELLFSSFPQNSE